MIWLKLAGAFMLGGAATIGALWLLIVTQWGRDW